MDARIKSGHNGEAARRRETRSDALCQSPVRRKAKTSSKEDAMTKTLDEVLAANETYAAEFGDKAKLAMPPARRFAILTAWMRGSIPPSSPA